MFFKVSVKHVIHLLSTSKYEFIFTGLKQKSCQIIICKLLWKGIKIQKFIVISEIWSNLHYHIPLNMHVTY